MTLRWKKHTQYYCVIENITPSLNAGYCKSYITNMFNRWVQFDDSDHTWVIHDHFPRQPYLSISRNQI